MWQEKPWERVQRTSTSKCWLLLFSKALDGEASCNADPVHLPQGGFCRGSRSFASCDSHLHPARHPCLLSEDPDPQAGTREVGTAASPASCSPLPPPLLAWQAQKALLGGPCGGSRSLLCPVKHTHAICLYRLPGGQRVSGQLPHTGCSLVLCGGPGRGPSPSRPCLSELREPVDVSTAQGCLLIFPESTARNRRLLWGGGPWSDHTRACRQGHGQASSGVPGSEVGEAGQPQGRVPAAPSQPRDLLGP